MQRGLSQEELANLVGVSRQSINSIERGRQKRTMADMRTVATAAEAYAVDYGVYPDADSIDQLAAILAPVYIRTMPRTDGWENLLAYQCWQVDLESEGCDSYAIASPGRDGLLEIRTTEGLDLKARAEVKSLVSAENADRLRLYKEIARANDFPEKADEVQRIFAETWREKADKGWFVEQPGGEWKGK